MVCSVNACGALSIADALTGSRTFIDVAALSDARRRRFAEYYRLRRIMGLALRRGLGRSASEDRFRDAQRRGG